MDFLGDFLDCLRYMMLDSAGHTGWWKYFLILGVATLLFGGGRKAETESGHYYKTV
jgi:hypothetical protein